MSDNTSTDLASTASCKPIFVPLAMPLAEAEEVFAAVRAVFQTVVAMGEAKSDSAGRLARGMVTIAEAIDKAQGSEDV